MNLTFIDIKEGIEAGIMASIENDSELKLDKVEGFIPANVAGAEAFNADLEFYRDSLPKTIEVANAALATFPDAESKRNFKRDLMRGIVEVNVLARKISACNGFGSTYDVMANFENFRQELEKCRPNLKQNGEGVHISFNLPPVQGKTTDGGKKNWTMEVVAGVAIGVLTFVGIVVVSMLLPAAELMAITANAAAAGLGVLFI